jgi:rRNA small subunit pseudouridine methyltransferase Nep1
MMMTTAKKQTKEMKKVWLLLVEAELELIPDSIRNHPGIKTYARNAGKEPSKILLDSSFHHNAMQSLKDGQRRGRPDIVHMCLLLALDSPVNKSGHLQIYVHTRDDKVIWVNPNVRLPKNYSRFIGLMEQLYEKKVIKSETEILLSIEDKTLPELLDELGTWNVLFCEQGDDVDTIDFLKDRKGKNLALLIGGFPHGEFTTALQVAQEKIRIGSESFAASTVVAKALFSYEEAVKNKHRKAS